MKYRNLGASGLKISELSLGSWLTYGETVDTSEAEAIIDAAYDCGINGFDTADCYNAGAAESVLGKALKKYDRSKIVVSSKVFVPMGEGPNERGLSRKHLTEQVDAILKRMDMDYLDILYCHRYDPSVPLAETLRTLDDLVRRGKVMYIGVSEWNASQIAQALAFEDRYLLDRLIVNQPLYNLLHRNIEREVLPFCSENGVGQLVYTPLAMGMLTGKYHKGQPGPAGSRLENPKIGRWVRNDYFSDENFEKVENLRAVAEKYGLDMAQMCLAWNLSRKGITGVIIGASRPEQVRRNVQAVDLCLTDEMMRDIDAAAPYPIEPPQ